MASENTTAAAGYIITFFNEIENLTHHTAGYCNVLTELREKYPGDQTLKKMDDTERQALQQSVKFSRYWVVRTYVKLSALAPKIPEFQKNLKQIESLKQPITSQGVPEYDTLEKYVLELNKLFVAGIMSELLTKAQDVYSKYSAQQNEP